MIIQGARTEDDVRRIAVVVACRFCGAHDLDDRGRVEASDASVRFHTTCGGCGRAALLEFQLDPRARSSPLANAALLEAYDRLSSRLEGSRVDEGRARIALASACLDDLLAKVDTKHTRHARLRRTYLEAERNRMARLASEPWPPSAATLTPVAMIAGATLAGQKPDAAHFARGRIVGSDLTSVDFSHARMEGIVFERCTLAKAHLRGAWLPSARILGGAWTGAQLDGATLTSLRATDVSFDEAGFGTATLDGASFERCSFRGASFATATERYGRTSANAAFVDCDLSGADWTERRLADTRFVRCDLAGTRGRPASVDGLVLEGCSVDLAAFLAQLGWNVATTRWWVEGELGSCDLRLGEIIGVEMVCDRPPTDEEARRALEPVADDVVLRRGGELGSTDRSIGAVRITPR